MSAPDSEPGSPAIALRAEEGDAGLRLDLWLARGLAPDLSRSRIQALIRDGAIRLDGAVVRDAKRKVVAGMAAEIAMPEAEAPEPTGEAIPLDILFEDDALIVIDKPAGLVVHPGPGNWTGTLVNALIHHCGDSLSGIGGVRRPGIVHRLDRDTSGVMVVAKTDRAHRALAEAFADHGRTGDLDRRYLALVWGAPERPAGTIDAPLGRSTQDRTRRAVVPAGRDDAREARTHYETQERFGPLAEPVASLVACQLETGRTHQIRVHMAHIGHPLIGDQEYGQGFRTKANRLPEPLGDAVRNFGRQALHAASLAFAHPTTGAYMEFATKPPADMAALIAGFAKITP